MKLTDLYEMESTSPVVASKDITTSDGKKVVLTMFVVHKFGTIEFMGLRLETPDGKDIVEPFKASTDEKFPDEFYFGTFTANNKEAMKEKFDEKIVPMFSKVAFKDLPAAFNQASQHLHADFE